MEFDQASRFTLESVWMYCVCEIPEARRTKLDEKGEKCIFVGYGDQTMGYKLYNPPTKKNIISRDVVFEEDQMWNWEDPQDKGKSIVVEGKEGEAEAPIPVDEPESSPRRTRSVRDIYEATEAPEENEDVNLMCFYMDTDPVSFH